MGFSKLTPMFDDAQILYLEEVLGTTARAFVVPVSAEPAVPKPAVIVVTPPLGDDERALLAKILSSVGLTNYRHVESGEPDLLDCVHCLHFHESARTGRASGERHVRWGFPPLRAMLGEGPEVTSLKRETWTLLQTFKREHA